MLSTKAFALRIFILLLLLVLSLPAVATQDKPLPTVTDQMFLSTGSEPPVALSHHRGRVIDPIPPNATVYIKIDGAKRAHDLTGLRGLIRWDEEPPTTVTPSIEYKKTYAADGKTSLGFTYLVALKVDSSYMVSDSYTLAGEAMIGERVSKSLKSQPFRIVIMNDVVNLPPTPLPYNPSNPIFDPEQKDRKVSIEFDGIASFEVDPFDQQEVNISFVTAASDAIEARYPHAKLRFVGWNHQPIFNRRGTLYLYCDDGSYLYKRTPYGLQPAPEGVYSQTDQAFVIETMHLGRYVISDKPLDKPIDISIKPNPPTGAV